MRCNVNPQTTTTSLNWYSTGERCVANILICIGKREEVVWLVKGPVCNWLASMLCVECNEGDEEEQSTSAMCIYK